MENEKKGFLHRTGTALGFIAPDVQQTRATAGPSAAVLPPSRSVISSISADTALQIGAVHRAVSILTASVSQMDLGVYRDGIEIKSPALIKNPNVDDSQKGFIEETVFSLATNGNAYWRVYGDPVVNIEVLDPETVTITKTNGVKKYFVGVTEVPAKNIRHLRLMRKPGHLKGYGPIQNGQSELIAALKMRSFADNWFGNSGVPTGVITMPGELGPDQAAEFSESWRLFLANHNGTAIMPNGMQYQPIGIKPAEAQFLEVQQAQIVGIARLFGTPPLLLGVGIEGTSTTYTNAQELWLQFLQTTLTKYMNEIEDALASLLPRGQTVNFKEEGLLRMDTLTAVQVQKTQIDARLRTPNEIRATENLPPLPEVAPVANTNESSDPNE